MLSNCLLTQTSNSRGTSKAYILDNILTPRDMEKVNYLLNSVDNVKKWVNHSWCNISLIVKG